MGTCLKLRPKPCPLHSPIPAARSVYVSYTSTGHICIKHINTQHTRTRRTEMRCRLPQPFNDNLDEGINGEKKTGVSRALNYHYVNISYRIDRQSISCKTFHFIIGKEKEKKREKNSSSHHPIKHSPVPFYPFHLNPSVNESVTMVTSNFYKCIFSPPLLHRVLKTHPDSMIIVEALEVSNLRTFSI